MSWKIFRFFGLFYLGHHPKKYGEPVGIGPGRGGPTCGNLDQLGWSNKYIIRIADIFWDAILKNTRGCVGMASVAVLEWPLWLCWNGLCGCVGMASVAALEWLAHSN